MQILREIKDQTELTKEVTGRLMDIFGVQRFLSAMEKISLNLIRKYKFIPSNRELWLIESSDDERAYLIYPMEYCSCKDFFLNGILKNRKYYCKHLIAQALYENLKINNDEENEIENTAEDSSTLILKDEEFYTIIKDAI
ncbi:MAG: hypothetical protein ACTSXF_11935 [Promethearchaeota archaeon]